MRGAIPPLPNTPSRRGAHLKQGQLYLYLLSFKLMLSAISCTQLTNSLPTFIRQTKSLRTCKVTI
jgi:hypothetical protein